MVQHDNPQASSSAIPPSGVRPPPSTEPLIEIKNVTKRFGDFTALDNVSVTIFKGEFFSLLGPSGCGKTTLLRIIAGLEVATEGQIIIAGQDSLKIPVHKRPVNTVFQSYALFPHMTVWQNIAFGLKMKQVPKAEIERRVDRIMEIVQITSLADRKPSALSGGQRQRVALSRAVVNEPQVLLLDEPLGALDLKLRKELQLELMSLQRRLGICFVCVTHDQEEALTMSDRIAVVNHGRIEQLGAAEDMYERPKTRFVSNFLGSANIIEATVTARDDRGVMVSTAAGPLRVDFALNPRECCKQDKFTLAIRPEKVTLVESPTEKSVNCIPVTVQELLYIGSETHYRLDAGGMCLSSEAMNSKAGSQGFDVGQKAYAHLLPAGLVVLDD